MEFVDKKWIFQNSYFRGFIDQINRVLTFWKESNIVDLNYIENSKLYSYFKLVYIIIYYLLLPKFDITKFYFPIKKFKKSK